MTNWMREPLHKHYAQSLSVDNLLYDSETDHQRIKVFENGTFGRILTRADHRRR
jgi:spermidine synthase